MAITQVTISIDTTNAAFTNDPYSDTREDGDVFDEVERIVRLALKRGLRHNQPLRDINGNTVGVVIVI